MNDVVRYVCINVNPSSPKLVYCCFIRIVVSAGVALLGLLIAFSEQNDGVRMTFSWVIFLHDCRAGEGGSRGGLVVGFGDTGASLVGTIGEFWMVAEKGEDFWGSQRPECDGLPIALRLGQEPAKSDVDEIRRGDPWKVE